MSRTQFIRRIIEVLLVVVCVYTFLFTTPVGELVRYGASKLFSSKAKRRSMVSYFQTSGAQSQNQAVAQRLATPLKKDDPFYAQAEALGLQPQLARAIVVTLSEGTLAVDGDAKIKLAPEGLRSFTSIGITEFNKIQDAQTCRTQLLQGIAALKERLKSEHAAITALSVDLRHVSYALGRARAAGMAQPTRYSAFSRFLPPHTKSAAKTHVRSVFALETAFEMSNPVRASHRVTSRFGFRVHPVLKTWREHTGIDVAIPTGTGLHASSAGKVVYATQDGINGKFVKIDHGHGLTSAYCHASKLLVKRGDRVKSGQKIALSGMTGRATGPHLHFQIEIDDVAIDPELFIRSFAKAKPVGLWLEVDTDRGGFAVHHHDVTHRRGG